MKNKPQPVVVTTVCSMCDQPWEAHGDDPTTLDCIRLLKAELARRPRSVTINTPWYPPSPYPSSPQIWCSTNSVPMTPRMADAS